MALLQYAADAMVMAATGIDVTASVRRRSARLLSARLRQAPTIAAAAATTPTATGFARAISLYQRRHNNPSDAASIRDSRLGAGQRPAKIERCPFCFGTKAIAWEMRAKVCFGACRRTGARPQTSDLPS